MYEVQLSEIKKSQGNSSARCSALENLLEPTNLNQQIHQANIALLIKNKDTLQQYTTQAYLDPDYIQKVQKWISKSKYQISEQFNDCSLNIAGCFNFNLPKSTKADSDVIKEELAELKADKMTLMRDVKLFQYYYFNFWKEKSRDVLCEKTYLLDSVIESPANLYNICEGLAIHSDEAIAATQGGVIGFKQPVAFLYHTGGGRMEDKIAVKGRLDLFEVFISGRSFNYHLAQISSKVLSEETVDGQTWYLHQCNLGLVPGARYNIYTPKILS